MYSYGTLKRLRRIIADEIRKYWFFRRINNAIWIDFFFFRSDIRRNFRSSTIHNTTFAAAIYVLLLLLYVFFFFFLLVQKRFNDDDRTPGTWRRLGGCSKYVPAVHCTPLESLVHFEASRTSKKKKNWISSSPADIPAVIQTIVTRACHAIHIGNLHHIETVQTQEDVAS